MENKVIKLEELKSLPIGMVCTIRGRVVFFRDLGKLIFGKLYDVDGIGQFSLTLENLKDQFKYFSQKIKTGNIISLTGYIYESKAGEKTVQATMVEILCTNTTPLPDKWHGLQDNDLKARYRYLDLIVSAETRNHFKLRHDIIRKIRNLLSDFTEVETPILQFVASGAAAKPFSTHYNAFSKNLNLRIAPELYLKRLLIGGFNRIFEIGKCFRNEGIDRTHLPEFTMLECYQTYITYEDLMNFAVNLLQELVRVVAPDGKIGSLDFNIIERISYGDFLKKYIGFSFDEINQNNIKEIALSLGLDLNLYIDFSSLLEAIYKKGGISKITNPILIYDYPRSPLAAVSERDSRFSSQFQIVVHGQEIIKACLEQNNPDIQEQAFLEQAELAKRGEEESVQYDGDFIEALRYGMPPAGGLGLGIDRLVSILGGCKAIRESVLYPMLRPLTEPSDK